MGRFQLEIIYYFTYFSTVIPSNSCVFLSCRKINTLEEIEILKAASSENMLNDIIAGQNDPIYKLLPLISDLNSKINSPGQATNKNS